MMLEVERCPECGCGEALHGAIGCMYEGENKFSESHIRTDDGSDPEFSWYVCNCPISDTLLAVMIEVKNRKVQT